MTDSTWTAMRDPVRMAVISLAFVGAFTSPGRGQLPDDPFGGSFVSCTSGEDDNAAIFGTAECMGNPDAGTTTGSTAATTDGSAWATARVERGSASDAGGLARADAAMAYDILLVRNFLPLPVQLLQVPLGIEYSLKVLRTERLAGASASINVAPKLGGPLLFQDSLTSTPPQIPPVTKRETARVSVAGIGGALRINLFASAGAQIRFVEDVNVFAVWGYAKADPIVFLDQAAMDEMYGEDSFPLADYYTIEVSPGISNALLFGDGFESGMTVDWSATVP